MRKNSALPYKTVIDKNIVKVTNWLLIEDDNRIPVNKEISGWDYDFDINLERKITIDKQNFLRETGLESVEPQLRLAVVVTSGAPGNRYRMNKYTKDFNLNDDWEEKITLFIKGCHLSNQVILNTNLLISSDLHTDNVFLPSKSGSILWQDEIKIMLEGSLSRFPMSIVNFDSNFPPDSPSALWHLSWRSDDLESAFMGSVILYLNGRNENLIKSIQNKDPLILSAIISDITRQMCLKVIEKYDDFGRLEELPEESTGAVIRDWIHLCFGDEKITRIREFMKSKQSELESKIQSAFSLRQ